jgi:hypothetical protein
MNILSLAASALLAPLQSVVVFFAPHAAPVRPVEVRAAQMGVMSAGQLGTGKPALMHHQSTLSVQIPPMHRVVHVVRVLRSVETDTPPDRAGRMVMSGRFADVCAELDRLAECEMAPA